MSKPQIQRDYELRELHESLSKSIRVIRAIRSRSIFVVLIIKFNVQTSNSKGTTNYANCTNHLAKAFVSLVPFVVVRSSNHNIQSSNLNVQRTRGSNHQIQCPNLKFKGTTNYANFTNHLAISIRVISAIRSRSMFVVLIIKFNVQTSNPKGLRITRIARISRQ